MDPAHQSRPENYLLGLYTTDDPDEKDEMAKCMKEIGFTDSKGKFRSVLNIGPLLSEATRALSEGNPVRSRLAALGCFLTSPIWIPLQSIASIATSVINIFMFGQISKKRGLIDGGPLDRLKAMGCSLVSIVTTPANIAVQGAVTFSHIFSPKLNRADVLATHLWTGFVKAKLHEKTET